MSLDPLHEQIARLAFGLPEAEQVPLAGGGAMLAHNLVARPTHDFRDRAHPLPGRGLALALT